ncbi:MAG: hypothetical protein K2J75_01070 [Clostridia bacterium]|nr:hypothetical protein [Clostridia bacterium]
MPRQYENFGIKDAGEFIANHLPDYIIDIQNIYRGYKNILIVHKSGDFEANCTLEIMERSLNLKTLNLHVNNKAVWTLEPTFVYNRNYTEWISCLCSINGSESCAPVCIINPDLLPRIEEGEIIQAKVIAFSVGLNTFATEEEMEKVFPIMQGMKINPELEDEVPDLNGQRIGIAQGLIFPTGFLLNHQVKNDSDDEASSSDYDYDDDLGTICGKIIGLRTLDKGDEQDVSCQIITINTEYGELDICVAEDEKDYSVGRYVLGSIVLSADVRVGEYEDGAIFNEMNLLKLLYESLESKDFLRIENILSDDCLILKKDSTQISKKANVIKYLDKLVKTNESFSKEFDYVIDNGVLSIFSLQDDACFASFQITFSDKKINKIIME